MAEAFFEQSNLKSVTKLTQVAGRDKGKNDAHGGPSAGQKSGKTIYSADVTNFDLDSMKLTAQMCRRNNAVVSTSRTGLDRLMGLMGINNVPLILMGINDY